MSTGQGLAGITMNVIRYFVTLGLGSPFGLPKDEKDTYYFVTGLIFFSIAAVFMVVNMLLIIVIY